MARIGAHLSFPLLPLHLLYLTYALIPIHRRYLLNSTVLWTTLPRSRIVSGWRRPLCLFPPFSWTISPPSSVEASLNPTSAHLSIESYPYDNDLAPHQLLCHAFFSTPTLHQTTHTHMRLRRIQLLYNSTLAVGSSIPRRHSPAACKTAHNHGAVSFVARLKHPIISLSSAHIFRTCETQVSQSLNQQLPPPSSFTKSLLTHVPIQPS